MASPSKRPSSMLDDELGSLCKVRKLEVQLTPSREPSETKASDHVSLTRSGRGITWELGGDGRPIYTVMKEPTLVDDIPRPPIRPIFDALGCTNSTNQLLLEGIATFYDQHCLDMPYEEALGFLRLADDIPLVSSDSWPFSHALGRPQHFENPTLAQVCILCCIFAKHRVLFRERDRRQGMLDGFLRKYNDVSWLPNQVPGLRTQFYRMKQYGFMESRVKQSSSNRGSERAAIEPILGNSESAQEEQNQSCTGAEQTETQHCNASDANSADETTRKLNELAQHFATSPSTQQAYANRPSEASHQMFKAMVPLLKGIQSTAQSNESRRQHDFKMFMRRVDDIQDQINKTSYDTTASFHGRLDGLENRLIHELGALDRKVCQLEVLVKDSIKDCSKLIKDHINVNLIRCFEQMKHQVKLSAAGQSTLTETYITTEFGKLADVLSIQIKEITSTVMCEMEEVIKAMKDESRNQAEQSAEEVKAFAVSQDSKIMQEIQKLLDEVQETVLSKQEDLNEALAATYPAKEALDDMVQSASAARESNDTRKSLASLERKVDALSGAFLRYMQDRQKR